MILVFKLQCCPASLSARARTLSWTVLLIQLQVEDRLRPAADPRLAVRVLESATVSEPELPAPANLSTSLRQLPCQQQCQPASEAASRQPYHEPTVAPGPASARGAGRGRTTLTLAGVLRDSLRNLP